MARFQYKVRDPSGKLITGFMEGTDMDSVVSKLMEKKYLVVAVGEEKENVWKMDFGQLLARIRAKDLVFLYMQMSNLINSGVTLLESLEVLEDQSTNPKLKKILAEIRKDVLAGKSLSEAMKKHPRAFPRLFISLIKAGETGGMLDKILEKIAAFTEKEHRLRGQIQSAIAYPIVMVIVAVSVVIFLLTFVFPKFVKIFERAGANLPLPTVMLIKMSGYLQNHWQSLIVILVVTFIGYKIVNRTKPGNLFFTRLKMFMPVFGDLIIKTSITRFCRTLGTLLENGVPIMTALDIVEDTLDNVILAGYIRRAAQDVKEGNPLASSLAPCKIFPPMIIKMIQVGEKTGGLSKMLIKSSDFYESEVEMTVETMISLLEPLLIVMMGGMVGFIALAMFMPIFDMTKTVK
ncbi:MAG: type II secretion system F family protein [Candidatus Wallbacteria bacterium]|nr:type II secretion system F family protein [Candidatus Wallbacteria bacterium]